jgi:hypothetical protein
VRNNYEASVDLFNGDKVVVVDEPDWSKSRSNYTQEVTRLTDSDVNGRFRFRKII